MVQGRTICAYIKVRSGLVIDERLQRACDVWNCSRGVRGAKPLRRAIENAKVAFVPGAANFTDGTGRNTIKLGYSLPTEARSPRAWLGDLVVAAASDLRQLLTRSGRRAGYHQSIFS